MPPRNKQVANKTKYGNRKITTINSTDTFRLQAIEVSSINGVSVKENEQLQVQQTEEINTSKEDITVLQNKVLVLENYVYDLRQIIYQLTNKTI